MNRSENGTSFVALCKLHHHTQPVQLYLIHTHSQKYPQSYENLDNECEIVPATQVQSLTGVQGDVR